jgi:hypothetical protein
MVVVVVAIEVVVAVAGTVLVVVSDTLPSPPLHALAARTAEIAKAESFIPINLPGYSPTPRPRSGPPR